MLIFLNCQVTEKPTLSEISKYIPSSESSRFRDGNFYSFPNSVLGREKSSNDSKMTESIMNIQPTNQCVAPASTATVFAPKASNDLLHFIEKQEGYIEQLERESQFCRVLYYFL